MRKRILTMGEASREIGCLPRDISDAIYARALDESRIVRIGARHAIPEDYLGALRAIMAARGKIRAELAMSEGAA